MSLLRRFANRIWLRLAYRFFKLKEIEKFIETTGERYIDAQLWADIQGVSIAEARAQLMEGVARRYFDECLLYEWSDAPVRFVVPAHYLGRTIRLSEIGYHGDDYDREVTISAYRVRKVYVAAEKA